VIDPTTMTRSALPNVASMRTEPPEMEGAGPAGMHDRGATM
jgi:hypothetical protein